MFGGLFNSKSKTTQQQTTTNNNYNIDNSDNSNKEWFDHSDNSIGGFMNASTFGGDVTITDGGAFNVASDALRFMDNSTFSAIKGMENTAFDALNNMTRVSLGANDLAIEFGRENAHLSREALTFGGDLMKDFMLESNRANSAATNAMIDGNRYALQFAESASRSDGQQLAIASNKTMMYLGLGLIAAGSLFALRK